MSEERFYILYLVAGQSQPEVSDKMHETADDFIWDSKTAIAWAKKLENLPTKYKESSDNDVDCPNWHCSKRDECGHAGPHEHSDHCKGNSDCPICIKAGTKLPQISIKCVVSSALDALGSHADWLSSHPNYTLVNFQVLDGQVNMFVKRINYKHK